MQFATSYDRSELPYSPFGLSGLGDAAKQDQITQITTTAVGAVGTAFTPVIANSIFASALTGLAPVWAVPVVGAAVFGVVLAIGLILGRKGPKQKEAATAAVESVIDQMNKLKAAYFEGPRTEASRLMALTAWDEAWAWLVSADGCGNPALGDAGKRCISERERGGSAKWCPTGTGCDLFVTSRDIIANDKGPDLATAGSSAGLLSSDMAVNLPGVGSVNVLLIAGAALIAWAVLNDA